MKVRRAEENAKKRKQRQCEKKVQDTKKDEELKGAKDSNDENNQMSDYEKLRQENIEDRNRKMKTLGVKNFFA